jgi:hypothetical protein
MNASSGRSVQTSDARNSATTALPSRAMKSHVSSVR